MSKNITIFLVKIYQFFREAKHSILYSIFGFSSTCRHNPSCSRYFINQVKERGTIAGSIKGIKRVLSCHS